MDGVEHLQAGTNPERVAGVGWLVHATLKPTVASQLPAHAPPYRGRPDPGQRLLASFHQSECRQRAVRATTVRFKTGRLPDTTVIVLPPRQVEGGEDDDDEEDECTLASSSCSLPPTYDGLENVVSGQWLAYARPVVQHVTNDAGTIEEAHIPFGTMEERGEATVRLLECTEQSEDRLLLHPLQIVAQQ